MATETKQQISPEHSERVQNALQLIQQAQYLIDDAAQQLCPVDGFGREWSGSHKVHDTIKRYWHRVERRRQQLEQP